MTNLKNKVALITGSARGIGKSIAIRFASLGANIVINYSKDKNAADASVSEIEKLGRKSIALQCDVSKPADIARLFQTAKQTFGKIDIAVVNAGVELPNVPFADLTEEQFDRLFDINTKGAFFTLQRAAEYVEDQGRIIYIGSTSADYPRAGYSLHGGSKAAPEFFVRVLAQELGKRGITVNTVLPTATQGAGVNTDITGNERIHQFVEEFMPMGRLANVDDIANVAEFLAGPLSSFVSGQQLMVTGGGLI